MDTGAVGFFDLEIYLVILKHTVYGGFRQVVKTTDCGSVMRGFESHNPPHNKNKHPLWVRFLYVRLGVVKQSVLQRWLV